MEYWHEEVLPWVMGANAEPSDIGKILLCQTGGHPVWLIRALLLAYFMNANFGYAGVMRSPEADPAHRVLSVKDNRMCRSLRGHPLSSWLDQVDRYWHKEFRMGRVPSCRLGWRNHWLFVLGWTRRRGSQSIASLGNQFHKLRRPLSYSSSFALRSQSNPSITIFSSSVPSSV